jgi:radical SAM superfamily enzyme YgiQ (UPF0313 family)
LKILLVSPPVFDFYSSPHRNEPLGLQYIKKALEIKGHVVEIYDAAVSGKVKKMKTPDEFSYLEKYYCEDTSPFSLFSGYKRFGDSFSKICMFCKQSNYDIIGISSLFSAYYPDVDKLASEIKKVSDALVVIGGTAVNSLKDSNITKSSADYLISGCGTVSMPQLVESLSGKIDLFEVPGLIYKKKGKIIRNKPSFDPAWLGNIIPDRAKFRNFRNKKTAQIIFSAGCRNHCSFCSIHKENRFSQRDKASIISELGFLGQQEVQLVDIEDDDLFSDRERALEIVEMLKDFKNLGMRFTAMNGITAKNIVNIAHLLPEAGFIKLDLSLVCASENISSEIGRPHRLKDIERIKAAVGGKCEIEVYLIPGLPGTTLQETLLTMVHLYKLRVKCGLSPLYLVPGVPMFEKTGIPENLRLCRGSALYPFSEKERDNIASLLKISRFLNYCSTAVKDYEFKENLNYFIKSTERNRWFAKTKDGKWVDSFSFSENYSNVLENILP